MDLAIGLTALALLAILAEALRESDLPEVEEADENWDWPPTTGVLKRERL